jgi:hypothetical protein
VADFRLWKKHLDVDVGTFRYQRSRLPNLMGYNLALKVDSLARMGTDQESEECAGTAIQGSMPC